MRVSLSAGCQTCNEEFGGIEIQENTTETRSFQKQSDGKLNLGQTNAMNDIIFHSLGRGVDVLG